MGKRDRNPVDAYRKEERQRELKKQKKVKEARQEATILLNNPDKIEEIIQKLQAQSEENRLDKTIKDKIREYQAMKSIAMKKQALNPAFSVQGEGQGLSTATTTSTNSSSGSDRRPEDSIFYHPTYNPTGVPPAGKEPAYRPRPPEIPPPGQVLMGHQYQQQQYQQQQFAYNNHHHSAMHNVSAGQVMGGINGIPLPPPRGISTPAVGGMNGIPPPPPPRVVPSVHGNVMNGAPLPHGYSSAPPPPPPLFQSGPANASATVQQYAPNPYRLGDVPAGAPVTTFPRTLHQEQQQGPEPEPEPVAVAEAEAEAEAVTDSGSNAAAPASIPVPAPAPLPQQAVSAPKVSSLFAAYGSDSSDDSDNDSDNDNNSSDDKPACTVATLPPTAPVPVPAVVPAAPPVPKVVKVDRGLTMFVPRRVSAAVAKPAVARSSTALAASTSTIAHAATISVPSAASVNVIATAAATAAATTTNITSISGTAASSIDDEYLQFVNEINAITE